MNLDVKAADIVQALYNWVGLCPDLVNTLPLEDCVYEWAEESSYTAITLELTLHASDSYFRIRATRYLADNSNTCNLYIGLERPHLAVRCMPVDNAQLHEMLQQFFNISPNSEITKTVRQRIVEL
jgi:hypothetical protein